jgi:predicted transcriptional regulator
MADWVGRRDNDRLSVQEMAKYLGISKRTLYRYIKRGLILKDVDNTISLTWLAHRLIFHLAFIRIAAKKKEDRNELDAQDTIISASQLYEPPIY